MFTRLLTKSLTIQRVPVRRFSLLLDNFSNKFQVDEFNRRTRTLEVRWSDGHTSKYHFIWLRDHCKCPKCTDPHSGQKSHNSADLPTNLSIKEVRPDKGKVKILWHDGHKGEYNIEWLRNNCYSPKSSVISNTNYHGMSLNVKYWTAKDIEHKAPVVLYDHIMNHSNKDLYLYTWLHQLYNYGISLVKNVPTNLGSIKSIVERICYIRPTMYGDIFDVKSVPEAINVAYTNVKLDVHQDICYYETPPGLQFLHCLKNEAKGGENVFVDGIKAAHLLKQNIPNSYKILTMYNTTYHKLGKDHNLQYRRPVIQENDQSQIISINYSPPFLGTLAIPYNAVEDYYQAWNDFTKILRDPQMQIEFKMQPGDMISFDNRRVLHARKEFDPSTGERHLQGTYVDLDDFYSKFKVLHQKFQNKQQK